MTPSPLITSSSFQFSADELGSTTPPESGCVPGDTTANGAACRPAENVAFAWRHRALFAEVADHNRAVIKARYLGADYGDPRHQYRNAWAEAASRLERAA